MWKWLHRLGAPERCYRLCRLLSPVFGVIFLVFFAIGLVGALYVSPADYQQGDAFRILYIHVPAAMMSMIIYGLMAMAAIGYFIWRIPAADWLAAVAAPLGALMAALTLITGSLWGRPTWGTYWIWDARLTSELLLLFLYLGVIAIRQMMSHADLAARATGIVTCVGVVNLPIIHYSVVWWHTLHQGATLLKLAGPSMPWPMLWPLLLMIVAYIGLVGFLITEKLSTKILKQKSESKWVRALFSQTMGESP